MTADERKDWIEERAAILEHDAGYTPTMALILAQAMCDRYEKNPLFAGLEER